MLSLIVMLILSVTPNRVTAITIPHYSGIPPYYRSSKVEGAASRRHCGVPETVTHRLLQGSARADRVLGYLGCDRHELVVRRRKLHY